MNKVVTFIPNAGGSIVSKNILSHKGKLRWCVREESVNDVDNGWRFFSDIDTEEYLSKADNMCICDFNTVANIEPAIIAIYNCKVGTDIELVEENGKKCFLDSVGMRHDMKPCILKIDAKQAWKEGIIFYYGNEKVWLADEIPSKYIMEM